MPEKDRYTDKEASAILRRAMEIESTKGEITHPEGLTRNDLDRIASEAGIDQAYVNEAIQQFHENDIVSAQERWLGAPEAYEIERTLDLELSEETWKTIVGELNAHFAEQNAGDISGNTFSWRHKHSLGYVHVMAQKHGDKTTLRLKSHIDDGVAVGLVITCAVAVLTSIAVLAPPTIPIVAKVGLLLANIAFWTQILRTFAGRAYRKDKTKMRKLFNRLEETAYLQSKTDLREQLSRSTSSQAGEEQAVESQQS